MTRPGPRTCSFPVGARRGCGYVTWLGAAPLAVHWRAPRSFQRARQPSLIVDFVLQEQRAVRDDVLARCEPGKDSDSAVDFGSDADDPRLEIAATRIDDH